MAEFVSLNVASSERDSVIFYDSPWNYDEKLINEADRILLCADSEWENIEKLHTIQKFFAIKGNLYIYNSNVRGVATSFGWARDLLTLSFVLHNTLSDMALCRHELFRYYSGGAVPMWENLNSLIKDENFIATDYIGIKIRILLGDEAPGCPFDEIPSDILQRAAEVFQNTKGEEREWLRRLEHERNLRFYKFHNYDYGLDLDDKKRTTPMLKPYDELGEAGGQLADIGWMLLGELAAHKQAKGR